MVFCFDCAEKAVFLWNMTLIKSDILVRFYDPISILQQWCELSYLPLVKDRSEPKVFFCPKKFMRYSNFRLLSAPHTGCIFWWIFYCKFSLDFYCIFFQKMTVSSLQDWLWVSVGSTSKHFSNYWSMFAIEMWPSCQNFSSKVLRFR